MFRLRTLVPLAIVIAAILIAIVPRQTFVSASDDKPKHKPTPTATVNPCSKDPKKDECRCKPYKGHECREIDDAGVVSLQVPGMRSNLRGVATSSSVGSAISIAPVQVAHVPARAHAFSLFAVGRIPALRLSTSGHLYQYKLANAKWSGISAIQRSGIYAASH